MYKNGELCISILHEPGVDQYGYEDAGERWLPVHTVESIVRLVSSSSISALGKLTLIMHHATNLAPLPARPAAHLGNLTAESGHARHELSRQRGRCGALALRPSPLLPRIATLTPSFGTMSLPSRPQKEVREDIATYRKKVRRLARRSAEEGFD